MAETGREEDVLEAAFFSGGVTAGGLKKAALDFVPLGQPHLNEGEISLVAFILGRRCTPALGSAGSLATWLAISWASADSWYLLTARGSLGLCTGVVSLAAPAYIGEIALAEDRGKQCAAHQTGIAAGIMYTYALGQFIDWSQLALCCAVPSILTAVLLVRAVESPRWLMEQGRHGDAQAALRRLRRYASLADTEFEVIEVIYPKTQKPIMHYMLAVIVIMTQQFSGVNVIMQYATGPLQVKFGVTAHEDFIFLAVIQLVTTAMCAQLLDLAGRVWPLAVSVTLCTGSMMVLGSVYFAAANPAYAMDSTLASNLIFGSKVVFSAAFSAGLGPASWVLAVELAPLRASGFDFGSVCAFYWASALAVVSLFATLGTDPHSLAVLSWVCGIITFAGGVTTFAFAPDTAGISVESILMEGQGYKPKKKKSDTVEAATSSITPRPDEAKALSQHKENSSKARLGVPAAERGHTAGVESAAEALAEDPDRHQERARALPGEVLRSGAISSSHSAVASTPSIHMSGSGRQN
ncbi:solute carrier family 2, facilitated glucose transporter member 8-like [Amblyomma americanum]